jgi:hypothetical protein
MFVLKLQLLKLKHLKNMALKTARLKNVIKMPVYEMLEKVNRYTKSSLKLSLGCTACSPPGDLAWCLSHHSPELCLKYHAVYRQNIASSLFCSPQCLESVTSTWIKNYIIHIFRIYISPNKIFIQIYNFLKISGRAINQLIVSQWQLNLLAAQYIVLYYRRPACHTL